MLVVFFFALEPVPAIVALLTEGGGPGAWIEVTGQAVFFAVGIVCAHLAFREEVNKDAGGLKRVGYTHEFDDLDVSKNS